MALLYRSGGDRLTIAMTKNPKDSWSSTMMIRNNFRVIWEIMVPKVPQFKGGWFNGGGRGWGPLTEATMLEGEGVVD